MLLITRIPFHAIMGPACSSRAHATIVMLLAKVPSTAFKQADMVTGDTILHYAVRNNNEELVSLLVALQRDLPFMLKAFNKDKRQPLHVALVAARFNENILRKLVHEGMDSVLLHGRGHVRSIATAACQRCNHLSKRVAQSQAHCCVCRIQMPVA